MKRLAAFTVVLIAGAVLLAACIEVGGVRVRLTRYAGNCTPPALAAPCCDSYAERNANITIDGTRYVTDRNGDVVVNLARNATHTAVYPGCGGEPAMLELAVAPDGTVTYDRTVIYGNGAVTTETARSRSLIEINLPCCAT